MVAALLPLSVASVGADGVEVVNVDGVPAFVSPMLFVSATLLVPSVLRVSVVLCAELLPAVKLSVPAPSDPPPLRPRLAVPPPAGIGPFGVTVTVAVVPPVVPLDGAMLMASDVATEGLGEDVPVNDALAGGAMDDPGAGHESVIVLAPLTRAVRVKATFAPGASLPLLGEIVTSAGEADAAHGAGTAPVFCTCQSVAATPTTALLWPGVSVSRGRASAPASRFSPVFTW